MAICNSLKSLLKDAAFENLLTYSEVLPEILNLILKNQRKNEFSAKCRLPFKKKKKFHIELKHSN